ncbi:hypothetical protein GCM10028785_11260 [Hydrogenophaga soli]
MELQGQFFGNSFRLQFTHQALAVTQVPKFGEQAQVSQMQNFTAANNHSTNGLRSTAPWFCHNNGITDRLLSTPMVLLMCGELHAHHVGQHCFIPMACLQFLQFHDRKKIEAKISIIWQRGAQ